MTNVLIVPPFRACDLERFCDIEGACCVYSAAPTAEELKIADVILGQPAPELLKQAENCSLLQITSAGVDGYVKRPELFAGRTLTNLSGAFGQSISEFALAMVLSLYKHLNLFRDNQTACEWKDEGVQYSPVGKRLLILGAGDIGSAVARLFRPFGCHIVGMRRVKRAVPPEFDGMITMEELEPELRQADIVFCALPATSETYKLINADRLALLKPSAVIVNCGRGNLIDCNALAERLSKGLLYGAALDVTDPEPLPKEHPLWKCKNAIITPHATGGSFGHLKATEDRLISICRENLVRFIEGRPLLNVVDFESGYRRADDRY